MKKKINYKNFVPIISFLPLISVFFYNPKEEILLLNTVTSDGILKLVTSVAVIYLINILYRVVYLKDKEKPFIPILAFSFIYNLIHLLSFFIMITGIVAMTEQNMSFEILNNLFVISLIIVITTQNFEVYAYKNLSPDQLLPTKNKIIPTLIIHITPVALMFISSINSGGTIWNNIFLLGLLLWNILFLYLIKPNLSLLIKSE